MYFVEQPKLGLIINVNNFLEFLNVFILLFDVKTEFEGFNPKITSEPTYSVISEICFLFTLIIFFFLKFLIILKLYYLNLYFLKTFH